MRPLPRDFQALDLLFQARALTQSQFQTALFSLSDPSSCARRLRTLVAERWIDRLPRRNPDEPFIYLLTRRSTVGNQLMQQVYGKEAYKAKTARLGSLDHLLGINAVRVRVLRATQELGWHLKLWLDSAELAPSFDGQLIPDAYFRLQRPVDGQLRTSGFFLELERSTKAERVLESKLVRYAELFRSGHYQQLFGIRGMRVLVVFSSDYRILPHTRIDSARRLAERLGITLAFFAALEELSASTPDELLTAPLWAQAGQPDRVALFESAAQTL
jgi:hypothetical protein